MPRGGVNVPRPEDHSSSDSGEDFRGGLPEKGKRPRVAAPSVPKNHILASERWRGSNLAEGLEKENFNVKFCDLPFGDFRPSDDLLLLYLSEADYVSGSRSFKPKLAKFFSSGAKFPQQQRLAVVCQRTDLSAKDYLAVQDLAVVELGLSVIPVTEKSQLPQLLVQFASVCDSKKVNRNPFLYGSQEDRCNLVKTLTTIPGVGERGARILLSEFKTLQKISQASEEELSKAVGSGVAKSVYQYFSA